MSTDTGTCDDLGDGGTRDLSGLAAAIGPTPLPQVTADPVTVPAPTGAPQHWGPPADEDLTMPATWATSPTAVQPWCSPRRTDLDRDPAADLPFGPAAYRGTTPHDAHAKPVDEVTAATGEQIVEVGYQIDPGVVGDSPLAASMADPRREELMNSVFGNLPPGAGSAYDPVPPPPLQLHQPEPEPEPRAAQVSLAVSEPVPAVDAQQTQTMRVGRHRRDEEPDVVTVDAPAPKRRGIFRGVAAVLPWKWRRR